jgi:putative ABC transport system ATP-binding protein
MIEVHNLKKIYQMNSKNTVTALDNISFTAQTKEIVAVVGSSGSGKSTLLNVLGGLDRMYEGEVIVDNKDIKKYNPNDFRRNKVGTIFQQFNLISALTVLENVLLPVKFGKQMSIKSAQERARYLLHKVGLLDRLNHKPNELSGGQMQRVAIARALLAKPEILLADEPTGNLDSTTGQDIMNLLMELNQEEDMTMFIVTHDLGLVQGIDRKLFLRDGQLVTNS